MIGSKGKWTGWAARTEPAPVFGQFRSVEAYPKNTKITNFFQHTSIDTIGSKFATFKQIQQSVTCLASQSEM